MPIALFCGNCNAKLNAPDAAAGKKVKCPKCATILQIPLPEPEPSFEVVDDEPAPRPITKAKPKPVVLDEGDEDEPPPRKKQTTKKPAVVLDEDDGDERPRLKKGKGKSKKQAGGNKPLILGGAVAGVALIGVLVWFFVLREPSVASNTPAPPPEDSSKAKTPRPQPGGRVKPPPAGWYTHTDNGFACSLPVGTRMAPPALPPGSPEPPVWRGVGRGVGYLVQRNAIERIAPEHRENLARNPDTGLQALATQYFGAYKIERTVSVTVDGVPGLQLTLSRPTDTLLVRLAVDDGGAWILTCSSREALTDTDDRVKPFFDGFVIGTQFKPTGGQTKPPPAGWRTGEFPEFSVWLRTENAKPANQYFKEGIGPLVPGTRIVSNEDLQGNRNQVVMALPLDKETAGAPLDQVVDDLVVGTFGKKEDIVTRSAGTLDGRPARQRVITKGAETVVVRGVVANNRLFLVASTGPGLTEQDADVMTFFDGFKIGADVPLPPLAAGPTAPLEPTDLSKYGVPVVVNLPKGTKVESILDDDDEKALTLELDRNITLFVNMPSSMKNWKELSDGSWKGWKTVKDEPHAHMWENPIGTGAAKVVAHGVFRLVPTAKGDVGFRVHSGGVNRAQADYVWDCLKTAKAK